MWYRVVSLQQLSLIYPVLYVKSEEFRNTPCVSLHPMGAHFWDRFSNYFLGST